MLVRYWSGERKLWHVVQVPTREREDARHASRALTMLQTERTRYRNRIHSLLALHGVRRGPIDAHFPRWVQATRDWAGEPLPAGVVTRLLLLWRVLRSVEGERQQARRSEHQAVRTAPVSSVAHRLGRLRAIGPRSATVLAHELFARDLRNRRQVGALTGLVSAPYDSGTRRIDQGLARSGLPAIRRVAVELAWAWLRYQPTSALSQWYHTRFGRGGAATRRIGIVAVARRLMIALWRYVTVGLLPEGALLKA
jgi:transposase